jgi:nitronate monooxygenase
VRLIVQVTNLDEVRHALEVGANVIVAQGAEAGGHGGGRAMLPFVPAVVDLASPTPVLATGGIADDRGPVVALALGAAGTLIGTRFQASLEALVAPRRPRRSSTATALTPSAAGYSTSPAARHGRRAIRLAPCATRSSTTGEAAERGDLTVVPVWASEAIDLIIDLASATDLVSVIAREAEKTLARAGRR